MYSARIVDSSSKRVELDCFRGFVSLLPVGHGTIDQFDKHTLLVQRLIDAVVEGLPLPIA